MVTFLENEADQIKAVILWESHNYVHKNTIYQSKIVTL